MSVKIWRPRETPLVVVKHGWRDKAYNGVDQCPSCHGWGCDAAVIGDGEEERRVHATCEACRGKGHS